MNTTNREDEVYDKLRSIFDPETLRLNLTTASMFIAVYESFKSLIVSNVKYFYCTGFDGDTELFDGYEENVLSKVKSKKNRQIRATLLWLKNNGAMSEDDIRKFKEFTDLRNRIGHSLLDGLIDGLPEDIYDQYSDMVKLFDKVSRWWIVEVEVATGIDSNIKDVAYDQVDSPLLAMIRIATDVALTGNDEHLKMLEQMRKRQASPPDSCNPVA